MRWIGSLVIRCSNWRVVGEFPDVPRLVAIAAPHSSNWDGIIGISAAYAMGVRATWMGKDSLFGQKLKLITSIFDIFHVSIPASRSQVFGMAKEAEANKQDLVTLTKKTIDEVQKILEYFVEIHEVPFGFSTAHKRFAT